MEIIFPAVTTPLKALNSWLFVEKSTTEKGDEDVRKVWALRTLTFCKLSFNFNLHYSAATRFKACSLRYRIKKNHAFCFSKQADEEQIRLLFVVSLHDHTTNQKHRDGLWHKGLQAPAVQNSWGHKHTGQTISLLLECWHTAWAWPAVSPSFFLRSPQTVLQLTLQL